MLPALLEDIQHNMYALADAFRQTRITDVHTMDELARAVDGGFARAMWCGDRACEDKIKELTAASSRNMPLRPDPHRGHLRLLRQKGRQAHLLRPCVLIPARRRAWPRRTSRPPAGRAPRERSGPGGRVPRERPDPGGGHGPGGRRGPGGRVPRERPGPDRRPGPGKHPPPGSPARPAGPLGLERHPAGRPCLRHRRAQPHLSGLWPAAHRKSVAEYHRQFTFPVRRYYERAGVTDETFEAVAHAWMAEYVRGFDSVPLHGDAAEALSRFAAAGAAQVVLSATRRDMLETQIARFSHPGLLHRRAGPVGHLRAQ